MKVKPSIKKKSIENLLFCLTVILVIWAISVGFLGVGENNQFYRFSFVPMLLWVVFVILNNHKTNRLVFPAIICIVFAIAIVVLITIHTGLSAGLPLEGLTFSGCLLCMLVIVCDKDVTRWGRGVLEVSILVGSICLIYSYYAYQHMYFLTLSKTIGAFNPQAIGCWIYTYFTFFIYILDSHGSYIKARFAKILILLLMGLVSALFLQITVETGSRGALVAIAFFLLFRFLPVFSFPTKKVWNVMISFFPMILIIISILLYVNNIFVDNRGVGLLDGREEKWIGYISQNVGHILFGNYLEMKTVYSHNISIDHFIRYGIVFTLLYNIALFNSLKKCGNKCTKDRRQYDAYMGFCGAILLSSIEGMIFSTGCGGLYFVSFALLLLSNSSLKRPALKSQHDSPKKARTR